MSAVISWITGLSASAYTVFLSAALVPSCPIDYPGVLAYSAVTGLSGLLTSNAAAPAGRARASGSWMRFALECAVLGILVLPLASPEWQYTSLVLYLRGRFLCQCRIQLCNQPCFWGFPAFSLLPPPPLPLPLLFFLLPLFSLFPPPPLPRLLLLLLSPPPLLLSAVPISWLTLQLTISHCGAVQM